MLIRLTSLAKQGPWCQFHCEISAFVWRPFGRQSASRLPLGVRPSAVIVRTPVERDSQGFLHMQHTSVLYASFADADRQVWELSAGPRLR